MTNQEKERRFAMLRSILPYTAGSQHHAIELLLQADTLLSTARKPQNDLEACEVNASPEEVLLHLREYCTPKEADLLQMLLNFFKAEHLFSNYQSFLDQQHLKKSVEKETASSNPSFHSNNAFSGNPLAMFLQLFGGFDQMASSDHLLEFLISQLTPDQKKAFEQMEFSAKKERS